MLRHALAVVRGCQESVDENGESLGVGSGIFYEGFYFFGLRWQSEEVERCPSDQRHAIRGGCDGKPRGHFSGDERIDGVALVCG